jgi:hypothetical protein
VEAALIAIAGYAVGTAQILFVDWIQRRREHTRHLRLLRAEFRRARDLLAQFGWTKGVPLESDAIPYPPRPSEQFPTTVATTDYYISDEHDDDNAQEGHLGILDGPGHLAIYHKAALDLVDQIRHAPAGPASRELMDRAVENARLYDQEVARTRYILESAMTDIDRRLQVA